MVAAQTSNLLTGHPTWKIRQYQPPLHKGNICTLGIACPPAITDRS